MPTDIWRIPRSPLSGGVAGSYLLKHKQDDFSGTLGILHFVDGLSIRPLTGQQLITFVAALGADMELVPADDEAREAMGMPVEAQEPSAELPPNERSEGDLPSCVLPCDIDHVHIVRGPAQNVPPTIVDADTLNAAQADTAAALQSAAQPEQDDLDAIEDVAVLGEMAKRLGIEPGNKQQKSLRKLIRAARAAAAPATAEPTAQASTGADDLDAIEDVGTLQAMASNLGMTVDARWLAPRLREEIRKARGW
jgi:hypothetical protein